CPLGRRRLPWRTRRAPSPPLVPCTTLFRSVGCAKSSLAHPRSRSSSSSKPMDDDRLASPENAEEPAAAALGIGETLRSARKERRSEEHTSELQSREKLICRLLLEKKKTTAP